MKKIIIISLIGILITAFSYAQSKRKYTDTAVLIGQLDAANAKGINALLSEGWKYKGNIYQTVALAGTINEEKRGYILLILTKPLKVKEDEQ